jgi:hypothetical protein
MALIERSSTEYGARPLKGSLHAKPGRCRELAHSAGGGVGNSVFARLLVAFCLKGKIERLQERPEDLVIL